MWTEEHALCDDCGAEVRLVTDGREALAYTTWTANPRDVQGQAEDVWRDGLSLVVSCPTERLGEARCLNEVRFNGEGRTLDSQAAPLAVQPILMETP